MSEYVSILDCAIARGVKPDENGSYSLGAIEDVGFPGMGGCQGCGACIAAYNAFPSTTGYLQCRDCIYDRGFENAEAFETYLKRLDSEDEYLDN